MNLRLEFENKYELWKNLVRGEGERVFVPTDDPIEIGSPIAVEIVLPELHLPIMLLGVVLARRPKSRRFGAGAYLRFETGEMAKCRKLLELAESPDRFASRRKKRAQCEVPVRLVHPAVDREQLATALSTGGCAMVTTEPFEVGQRADMALSLSNDEELVLAGEVVWVDRVEQRVGFRFIDITEEQQAQLNEEVDRLLDVHERRLQVPSIVLADDDSVIRNLIHDALSPYGYEVHRATNGEEALALIRLVRPNLVLLDLLMPGVDGAEICQIMRSDETLADIPVIFISALSAAEVERVAEEVGASDFISKSEDLTILINMVGDYLRR